jgi:hypothetical protein
MPILVALRDRIGKCDSGEVGSARFPNHETWREEYASFGEGGFRHPLHHGAKGCDRNLPVRLADGC